MHIRIEIPQTEPGALHVTTNDRILLVDDDGSEHDVSKLVTRWATTSEVGAARKLHLDLFRFEIVEVPLDPEIGRPTDEQKYGPQ